MPDVPSLSLAIVGLYLFLRWIEDRESVSFFLAAITVSLSILIKVTSIVIFAPVLYLAVAAVHERRRNKERRFSKPPGGSGERPSFKFPSHRAPLPWVAPFSSRPSLPRSAWV